MPSSATDGFVLRPMTEELARKIAGWEYAGEYAVYNSRPNDVDAAVRDYLEPAFDYHAVWHPEYRLAGFCCYGPDAQAPGGDYAERAIDIGIGLRPDLVGRGFGRSVLAAVLAERSGDGLPFRATVATFNLRSRRLFKKAGFVEEQSFTADAMTREGERLAFVVLVRRSTAEISLNSE